MVRKKIPHQPSRCEMESYTAREMVPQEQRQLWLEQIWTLSYLGGLSWCKWKNSIIIKLQLAPVSGAFGQTMDWQRVLSVWHFKDVDFRNVGDIKRN